MIVIIAAAVLLVICLLIAVLSGAFRENDYLDETGWERKKRKLFITGGKPPVFSV